MDLPFSFAGPLVFHQVFRSRLLPTSDLGTGKRQGRHSQSSVSRSLCVLAGSPEESPDSRKLVLLKSGIFMGTPAHTPASVEYPQGRYLPGTPVASPVLRDSN